MIIDTLDNLGKYVAMNPLFADVIDFLKTHDLDALDTGKYPIKGENLFLNLAVAKGRTKAEAVVETHVEMIDIQIPLSGEETYGYLPLQDLPEMAYDAERDLTLYGEVRAQTYVTLKPGQMVIFFPQDGHAPCVSDEAEIRKAIFKVSVL